MALYAFDGTWNEQRDAGLYGLNTNVVRFRDAYRGGSAFYAKGVGTRLGWPGKLLGGAFGAGGKQRIAQARAELAANYRAGDRHIDIIGFSRGAALALHFANTLQRRGVRDPASGQLLAAHAEIRFLGLWDTVAAFGIPIDLGIPFQRINLGYRLRVPANVRHCCHALALDEQRATFRPTRTPDGEQVWFRGMHTDVGGGNGNEGLNAISLRWMLRKALACGLPIAPGADAEAGQRADAGAPIGRHRRAGRRHVRKPRPGERVHYTVRARPQHVNPPPGHAVETEAGERVVALRAGQS